MPPKSAPIPDTSLLQTTHGQTRHKSYQIEAPVAVTARKAIENVTKNSNIITDRKVERFPHFDRDEIQLGTLLGSGGFSRVFEIRSITIKDEERKSMASVRGLGGGDKFSEESGDKGKLNELGDSGKLVIDDDEFESKKFIAKHCMRDSSGDARYAMKFLKGEVVTNKEMYREGAADLATEVYFLANISHPNIIKLRGLCSDGIDGFSSTKTLGGFFFVMDRLYDTLEVRIEKWAQKAKKSPNFLRKLLPNRKSKSKCTKEQLFLADRLNVAFDIAGALSYLHENNIIYRDLKPENIGFDIRGDVKIFDFGLAKELQSDEQRPDETYRLSVNTGSRRYMAPEVAKAMCYNLSADVYSFGVLLWEICTMKRPWENYGYKEHQDKVIYGQKRLKLPLNSSFRVNSLIKRSWSDDWNERPKFENIVKILKSEVSSLRDGDNTGLEHVRRRSTFVRRGDESKYFISTKSLKGLFAKSA